jgi:hypothetical protein
MRLAVALIGALWPALFHPAPSTVITTTYGLGEWRLMVQQDTFAHQVSCQIENRNGFHPDVSVARGAVQFRLTQNIDTDDAWYQLDGQPSRRTRDLYSDLLKKGAVNAAESLDGSPRGVVKIPIGVTDKAALIKIRGAANDRVISFRIKELTYLISSGRGVGCSFN